METVEADDEGASLFRRLRSSNMPALLLLLLSVLLFGVAGWLFWRDDVEVDRNAGFTIRLERLGSALKDLETSQRGFLLTGDDSYLEPFRAAEPVVDGHLQVLQSTGLPVGNLADLVAERRRALTTGIEMYRTAGAGAALAFVQQGHGKALMDSIRTLVQSEEDAADRRISGFRSNERRVVAPLALVATAAMISAFTLLVLSTIRRRRAQQASAALLEGVLDNAPVGLGFLDRRLRVRRMNRALRGMGERALSAELGQSIWEVLPQFRERLDQRLEGVVAGGRAVHNLEVEAADHEAPGQMRSYQVSFYPLVRAAKDHETADGQGAGMVVLDVTARKRSERRLRESEERFRTLTESVSSMVWTTDGDARFVIPQPEWTTFTGQVFEACRDFGWQAAVHPDDLPSLLGTWENARAAEAPFKNEHRLRRSDGVWRYTEAAVVPIADGGRIREWVGSHTDITERREAELELAAAKTAAEAANRAKSVFLANMSHELRTPLSAVIGYSEMMEEEVEDLAIDSLSADLRKINSNARHLLSLINDVLDLSKIEANRMDVFTETVELGLLLEDVAATVGSLVAKKSNTLDYIPSAGLGTMRTDAVKLRQCLFNLLSNAAKFTEGGRITLRAERRAGKKGDVVEFRVGDSGIGMSREQVDRLFQRFSQADETTTRKFGGTGLGLAITRAFCRLLGGDISVESTPGVGSTFIMTLPATMPEHDAAADEGEQTSPAEAPHPRERELVLIIDDDASQRDITARFLERQGFATRTAADGKAGLDLARSLLPRAILLDVMMPHMDGWSVLTALKADPDLAKIPVVMVTFVHDTGMGATLGAADYLMKPVNWDTLKAVMDRFRSAEGDVLVVDDDEDARARLVTVLERNGWTTQQAGNGREALDLVSRSVPRVILLDLTMPVMDGFSFLAELRERPGCADVPVIVLTARDLTPSDRQRLETADSVFSKGMVSLSEITREIRAVAPPVSEPERAGEPSV